MPTYSIWYMRPDWFPEGIIGQRPNPLALSKTHVLLKDIELDKGVFNPFEYIYYHMQGENWSPNGEARSLIQEKGLYHTSMSVGDVIVSEDGTYVVADYGFDRLK